MELLETNREPFSRGMNTSLCVAYGSSSASSTMAVPCGLAALFTVGHITPALAEELARLAENQPMTGPRLAAILRSERTTWNTLLAQVGPERMEIPGAVGDWSVKQLVAHLTWYERAVVEGAEQVLQTKTETFRRRRPEGVSMDEMNAQIAEESRACPAVEVLAEADEVFGQLLMLIEACPDNLVNDPHVLELDADMAPWMGVANNSYAHYREHEPELRAWLQKASETRDSKCISLGGYMNAVVIYDSQYGNTERIAPAVADTLLKCLWADEGNPCRSSLSSLAPRDRSARGRLPDPRVPTNARDAVLARPRLTVNAEEPGCRVL
jgi:hypothetical protein